MELIKEWARSTSLTYSGYYLVKVLNDAPLRDWLKISKLNLFRKTYPYTMVRYDRLSNAFDLANQIERDGIKGAIVECGVWRGGCIATMAWVSKQVGSNRHIWLFDSFEGLPKPVEKDGEKGQLHIGDYAAPQQAAEEILFKILKIDPNQVHIVKGWFQDSLPLTKDQVGPIAILRLDGDLYESTKFPLNHLYPQVVHGGYVIIDDYGCWEGCQIATDEFIANSGIDIQLEVIDDKGRYWQKK
jgi:hypothetical protein